MSGADVWRLSATALAARVRAGDLAVADAVESGWRGPAAAWEADVHAVAHTDPGARAAASSAAARDRRTAPLAGVPVLVKDNLCTTDYPTTCGSRILAGYRPPYDATVIGRLRDHGAVVIGKGNMDEFAMGSSTEFSAYGPTRNPYDLGRVPGGSSGGPAAAVAYGLCPVGLGSDTGGSVRQPAAFCGVFGLKPTYGRLSRYGLVAFGSSLDQVGIFARHAGDVAATYAALAGPDPHDATTRQTPAPDVSRWDRGVAGLTFGWPANLWREGVEPDVVEGLEIAAVALERAGARRVAFDFMPGEYAVATYYLVATAEASSNLARFDGVRYGFRHDDAPDVRALYTRTRSAGFGPEVQRRILLGTYALSAGYYDAYYLTAQRARTRIRREYEAAFARCDCMLMPASPTLPFRLGEKTDDPLAMYLSDIFTIGANLAGIPGLTVPVGLTGANGRPPLPRAVQVLGPEDAEPVLLAAGRALEVGGDTIRLGAAHDTEFAWPTKR
ncbi:MAG: Asp-tRNA(Asn)/Glu-tRNA(Gln) amidotransferase subunit GatA [Candidatus Eisenbacteria bacterium]|uniref:Glutamyl-tRNA(Gln) amidotransferase subunit A n=1 Tax=Eiseniibacteriota bacterium TaxID=2212470 RepID=A0A9D6L981_UNCEI|nr:Asp-tRNA(Asn)/Glu-tRNA(Gln) amidotransferase subunit GatA [Candidatus Eisenbacteria bacterium]MBI3539222.1 Asp-tRNA(Asn)/Glu-tRNA(Gln) amidotransferase subunit GatA [Candidatus Eisenbacteria bacterium]